MRGYGSEYDRGPGWRWERGGLSPEHTRYRAFGGRYSGNRYEEGNRYAPPSNYEGSGYPVGRGARTYDTARGPAGGWRPFKGNYPDVSGYDVRTGYRTTGRGSPGSGRAHRGGYGEGFRRGYDRGW